MTRHTELPLALDATAATPLYVQIARAIATDVRRGRLVPGAALPGTRSLALSLGVHRNTVLAAYAELVAEGWASTVAGGGTFVSSALPDPLPSRGPSNPRGGMVREPPFSVSSRRTHANSLPDRTAPLMMLGGSPDLRLLPTALIARAYRRALARGRGRLLAYGDAAGEPSLRAAVARLVARRRGVPARPENVLITRGSQMALDLVARALVAPGDRVAIEALGYRPAWTALEAAGAALLPIPVDGSGLVVPVLARAANRQPIRAIYVTPHHQYPTTAVLAPGRRIELLRLAARKRIAVIEDDYDHEFHHEGRPVLPLASADERGSVIYIGTLSKVLAPGLRLGFIVAPEKLIEQLAADRFAIDRQGDHALEAAVAELIEEGELERHVRKMQRVYRTRRDVLVDLLEQKFRDRLRPVIPAGGMALWARALGNDDVDAWHQRALERGVLFQTARQFAFDGRARPFVRLGFAALNEDELGSAVKILSSTWFGRRRP